MGKIYPALGGLTGGTSGMLDAIDGAALSDGDAAQAVVSGNNYHYHLNASSSASENSPYVIVPDTNPGTKRWELVVPQSPNTHFVCRSLATLTGIAFNYVILFDTIETNALDEVYPDPSHQYSLEVSRAGYYMCLHTVCLANGYLDDDSYIRPFLYINSVVDVLGKEIRSPIRLTGGGELSSSLHTTVWLDALDGIGFGVAQWSGSGVTKSTHSNDYRTWGSITRLL
jgi:hypothetical protein